MTVLMQKEGETITARRRHVANLAAQGWQVADESENEGEHSPVSDPRPISPPDPTPNEGEEIEGQAALDLTDNENDKPKLDGVPPLNASRAAWRDYALAQNVNPEGLNRKQIQQALGAR